MYSERNEVINRNGRVFNTIYSGTRSLNFRDTILGIKANRRWDNGQFHFRGVAVFSSLNLGWIDNYTVLLLCTAILADRRAYAKFLKRSLRGRRGGEFASMPFHYAIVESSLESRGSIPRGYHRLSISLATRE